MQVKAKVTHFHSGALREVGEVFEYTGPIYEHVVAVKAKGKSSADTDDTTSQGASD